ncbi:hypothetical protein [Pseudomonas sp. NPDC079086]|jgi:hypothetical protein|uniref:hypothetical protein n=1 Tax=unclassified Pseudomonas TaxID=196821 RepID=UPI0037CB723B
MQVKPQEVSADKAITSDLDSIIDSIIEDSGYPDGVELELCFVSSPRGIEAGIGIYTDDMDFPLTISLNRLKQLVEAIEAEVINA